ncbi:MAG: TetR/AcrR family transcriptional regulator [Selenomonadaceae bacterium]|nr:TetR/AcrR family transcriptional regulator [Selenomonadaceae bacterium]
MRTDTRITRQNLIDAFCILAKTKSVSKITVDQLVDKAGYNRSTFYKYFRDVYDVLEQIEGVVISGVAENFRQNISPENFEQTFLTAFTKIQREQANYFDVLLNQNNRARFIEKLFAEISPIFMETFNLPPDNLKSKYLTEIYLITVISAVRLWINDGRKFSAEELSRFVGAILSRGVLTFIKNNSC